MMKTALPAVLLALSCAAAAAVPDAVVFGDPASESLHSVFARYAPIQPGAFEQTCRRLSGGGSLTFTLACDPAAQNYLTVKLWGGDTVRGTQYLYLYDPVNRIGAYQDDWPEVAVWTEQAPFPGRFVYSTYLIPPHLTTGKTQVTLKLADAELAIYRVCSHLEAFFDPEEGVQGVGPDPAPVRPAGVRPPYDQLVYQANLGIAEFLSWQKYGPGWNADVAAGRAPAVITGAITFDGRGGNASWTVPQWKEDIYTRFANSNMVCMQALEAYALAYTRPWSAYYQNPEMVDRILRGLDFFRIAQGANGAFGNPWGLKWLGGPDRVNGAHPLEGFGVYALATAFLLVHEDIDAAMLNQPVDEDDNPATPTVTRKTAYVNLFKGIVGHMLTDRGHAPNQDRAQVHAMVRANQCLRILSPDQAWPDSAEQQWIYEAMGVQPCPVYDGFWESQKGLALEVHGTINGGYCGNYGAAALSFVYPYGQMTGGTDPVVNGRIHDNINAFAYYLYPGQDGDGYRAWVNESVVSWRPNRYPARAVVSEGVFNGLAWAALHLDDPYAERLLRDYMDHQQVYAIDCSASAVAAHYEDNTIGAIRMVDQYEAAAALAGERVELPMERDRAVAWADEDAAAVVIHHQGGRLYMTLNWRHEYCSGCERTEANAAANNIARVHYTTDTIDRIANIKMYTPQGLFNLYLCRYGDYWIAMNLSETRSFELDLSGFPSDTAVDLISRTKIELSAGQPVLAPRSTMVLFPGSCLEFLPSDLNRDCRVSLPDFVMFASDWIASVE